MDARVNMGQKMKDVKIGLSWPHHSFGTYKRISKFMGVSVVMWRA